MLVHYQIKSAEDLENVFMELGQRAHEAGVSLPHHEGSLRQGLIIIYRGHGTYRGNPFRILATTIESQTTTQPERRAIAMELVYYAGFWEMFNA
jgi:hypothetical protein